MIVYPCDPYLVVYTDCNPQKMLATMVSVVDLSPALLMSWMANAAICLFYMIEDMNVYNYIDYVDTF